MKIELRISPVHLYLVTPSDKSFLLWKWILWCIIWFSLWKWPFILYDSCVSRGAPAPFHFYGWGFRADVVNLNHSVRYESLIRETRVHPSQLYMSISGFIFITMLVNRESYYSSHTIYSQPGIIALPRITADYQHNINIEQPLLLSLKPRLI